MELGKSTICSQLQQQFSEDIQKHQIKYKNIYKI